MKRLRIVLIPLLLAGSLQGARSQDRFPEFPPEGPALKKLLEMYYVGLVKRDGVFRGGRGLATMVAYSVAEAVSVFEEEVRVLSTKLHGDTDGYEFRFRRLSLWLKHVPDMRSIIEEYEPHLRRIDREPEKLLADLNHAEAWILRNQDRFPDVPAEWYELFGIAADGMLYPDRRLLIRNPFSSIADGVKQLTEGYIQHILAAEDLLAEARFTPRSSPKRAAAAVYVVRVKSWEPHIDTLRAIIRNNEEYIVDQGVDVEMLRETLDLVAYRTRMIQPADYEEQQEPFPDVSEDHWAYDAVNNLKRLGILVGYPDGRFKGGS